MAPRGTKGAWSNLIFSSCFLEHPVLSQLEPSPGCTWAEFNPQIGLCKRKGPGRRDPSGESGGTKPHFSLPPGVDRVAGLLKFHVRLVMLPCSPGGWWFLVYLLPGALHGGEGETQTVAGSGRATPDLHRESGGWGCFHCTALSLSSWEHLCSRNSGLKPRLWARQMCKE